MTCYSQFYEVGLNSVELDRGSLVKRESPRPVDLRQADYDEKFDDRTLFYDCFVDEYGAIVLSGPPLLNLREPLISAKWYVGGEYHEPLLTDLDRTQRSVIPGQFHSDSKLEIESQVGSFEVKLGSDLNEVFAGRKVLMTKSKNNDLAWIRDWIEFHTKVHGYDAILFYDNDSTEYSTRELVNVISSVSAVDVGVVVSWPFKFGPQAGDYGGVTGAPWDSDFTEYGILEHARFRFLTRAAYVSNHDVDELVICEDGRTVFEHVEESPSRAIRYKGRWIERHGEPFARTPRHSDFVYFDIDRAHGTTKWTAAGEVMKDSNQWSTHNIRGIRMENVTSVLHRHFKGISNSWKYDRTQVDSVDISRLAVDRALEPYLMALFGRPDDRMARQHTAADLSAYYMDSLRSVVDSASFSYSSPCCSKVRWYRPHVAVVDCNVDGIEFGFDIVASVEGIRAEVVGRGNHGAAIIRALTDRFRISSQGKLDIANLKWGAGVEAIGHRLSCSLSEVVEILRRD